MVKAKRSVPNRLIILIVACFCTPFIIAGTLWPDSQNPVATPSSTSGLTGVWKLYDKGKVTALPKCSSIIPGKGWFYGHGHVLFYRQGEQLRGCLFEEGFIDTFQALSANNQWAGGVDVDLRREFVVDDDLHPMIYHWNGQLWQSRPAPDFQQPNWASGSGSLEFSDLFFLSPNRSWAVGGASGEYINRFTGQRFIFQWDGESWKSVRLPGLNMQDFPLISIHMFDEDNGWLAGASNHVYYWDGNLWKEVFPEDGQPFKLVVTSLFALSNDNIWLVGYDGHLKDITEGVIYHWDGKGWREQYRGGQVGLSSISMLNPNFGWAVGGNIIGGFGSTILYWNGKAWGRYSFTDSVHLRSVQTISDQEAWIFGDIIGPDQYFVYRYSDQPENIFTPLPNATLPFTDTPPMIQKTSIPTYTTTLSITPSKVSTTFANSNNPAQQIEWIPVVLLPGLLIGVLLFLFLWMRRK